MKRTILPYVPSSTSERNKRIKTDHDPIGEDLESCFDPLDMMDVLMDEPSYEGELGFGGRFSNWTPDHVVLECLDGTKLSISKAALCHSRSVNSKRVRAIISVAESTANSSKICLISRTHQTIHNPPYPHSSPQNTCTSC